MKVSHLGPENSCSIDSKIYVISIAGNDKFWSTEDIIILKQVLMKILIKQTTSLTHFEPVLTHA